MLSAIVEAGGRKLNKIGVKSEQVQKPNSYVLTRALKAGGNKNYTVKELPKLNHLLQTAETGNISEYRKIEETLSPTALQIIGDWILEQTDSHRAPRLQSTVPAALFYFSDLGFPSGPFASKWFEA